MERTGKGAWLARTILVAILAFWTLDCMTILELPKVFSGQGSLHATPTDFLGLLLAEIVPALVLVAFSLLGASLTNRVPGSLGFRLESAVLLATMSGSIFSFLWLERAFAMPRVVAVGIVLFAALLLWGFFRWGLFRWGSVRWGLGRNPAAGLLRVPRVIGWISLGTAVTLAVTACVRSGALSASWEELSTEPAPSDRPDIVLIVLDTVRADHLRRFGYDRNTMPGLEAWAESSLTFERAVSSGGWTAPAHASIFSGRTVSEHGVHSSHRPTELRTEPFGDIEWLPATLAGEGYRCIAVTSNVLSLPDENLGFHAVVLPERSRMGSTLGGLFDAKLARFGRWSEQLRWRMPYADAEAMVGATLRSVRSDERPLFLFLNLFDAHSPYNPPRSVREALGPDVGAARLFPRYWNHRELTTHWEALPEGKHEDLRDQYDAELRGLDVQLGRFFEGLASRRDRPAVIVVTSDHGEELGEQGRVGHEFGVAQSLVHVPLFVRTPGVSPGVASEVTSTRFLHRYLAECGTRAFTDPVLLSEAGAAGVIAERYPSAYHERFLGPGYGRPYVAFFEDGVKLVGPSAVGLDAYSVSNPRFREERLQSAPAGLPGLRDRLDLYWETSRDERGGTKDGGTGETEGSMDEQTRERLKSLGYF